MKAGSVNSAYLPKRFLYIGLNFYSFLKEEIANSQAGPIIRGFLSSNGFSETFLERLLPPRYLIPHYSSSNGRWATYISYPSKDSSILFGQATLREGKEMHAITQVEPS